MTESLRNILHLSRAVLVVFLIATVESRLVRGEVFLAAPFSEGVVLQRDKPVAIWGTANPGEHVTVRFEQQTKSAEADREGRWRVQLDPLPASPDPATLQATGENVVEVEDVLVGEVWLCSGQSNMNLPLSSARDAAREIAAAEYPLIRHFDVRSTIGPTPAETAGGEWVECSPETAGQFTAVGYFFARELHRELGVPVGIIKSTLGGSPIESWISADALARTPVSTAAHTQWEQMSSGYRRREADYQSQLSAWKARAAQSGVAGQPFNDPKPVMSYEESDRNMPSGLYNGFIHPLRQLTLAGFLWYQGEGNVGRAADYRILMPTMVRQWRQDFQQATLPFLFVQLPNFDATDDAAGEQWAWLREAQAAACSLPNTGMAVTIDVGDPNDTHPANKQAVGRRLGQIALRQVYEREIESRGPMVIGVQRQGSALRVRFDHAAGLEVKGDAKKAFRIAGRDRRFFPAEVHIEGDAITASAAEVEKPVAVRYAWQNNPTAVLVNSAGLPAAPFRSDAW